MSQAKKAAESTLSADSTANPRRTTLASVEDFGQIPGARRPEAVTYPTDLPTSTANPRRTRLMVAPVVNVPQD
ncbi:hypothetical protein OG401_26780 [Kitasatospora purpeofusca]|uniref:hypothetical protein n=1 Tax=Kitasatospora purpeofusca TaxID=67352 RepID=UPI000ADB932B|nr:hypothetical protein [Kitasatospora purpeofusca]MCX4687868.1 hypothetical protein [Kitasatospora purpeofusca]MCX4755028.1 hypothetical protein [Kitasatospora purpeofusca]WSR34401.1 hypothetical protein OG715_27530 [Kitasatospora purpeofusca]WSR42626.1 hypothetical protein OG196_28095 [Kitasatospora purpeofusca]